MKKGRQSSNVEDVRGGQSFGSALMGGLRQMGTAFDPIPNESAAQLSQKFTKSGNPAGAPRMDNADIHSQLRKGF